MKKLLFLTLFGLSTLNLIAQKSDVTELFREQKVLDTKLRVSIKDIKKKTNDSTYLPSALYIKNENGQWDSVKIGVRARGIYRRKNCYFSPIRIKVNKSDAKGTLVEGNKSLKLVMPCMNNDGKNASNASQRRRNAVRHRSNIAAMPSVMQRAASALMIVALSTDMRCPPVIAT